MRDDTFALLREGDVCRMKLKVPPFEKLSFLCN
jgi:hypothetical protein